jgi:hypothetical protein
VVSLLMLDILGAYDNVSHEQLLYTMRVFLSNKSSKSYCPEFGNCGMIERLIYLSRQLLGSQWYGPDWVHYERIYTELQKRPYDSR